MRPHVSVNFGFIISLLCVTLSPSDGQLQQLDKSRVKEHPHFIEAASIHAPASDQQPQLLDPERIKEMVGVVKEKLPEVMDKERIHKLAEQMTEIMEDNRFGLKTINLDNIPTPMAYNDALLDTLEHFVPELLPSSKFIPMLIKMAKFYQESLTNSPHKLLE